MKNKIIAALVALALVLSILYCFMDATFFSSSRVHVTNETIESAILAEDLDGISVMVLSDIEYGNFMTQKRLSRVINKVNVIQPDLVLFLGDLFDKNYMYTTQDEETLVELLGSIDAKLGKFAVLGDYDMSHKEAVTKVLNASGFEILSNEVRRIHNETAAYLNLVAINQSVVADPTDTTKKDTKKNDSTEKDSSTTEPTEQETTTPTSSMSDEELALKSSIESLYSSLSDSVFTITMTHNSDNLKYIPTGTSQLAFAGNSHGAQIMLPIFGASHDTPGNSQYIVGSYHNGTTQIYVSHGLGNTGNSIRLFSDPELVYYRLFKKKSS